MSRSRTDDLRDQLERLATSLDVYGPSEPVPPDRLDELADKLVAVMRRYALEDLNGSEEAERALARITRAFEAPGQSMRYVGVTDRLLRAGFEHPLIVSGLVQALLDGPTPDFNGVHAAQAVFDKHPFDRGAFNDLWYALYLTRKGRAHKDLFNLALKEKNAAAAAKEGRAALTAYHQAAEVSQDAVPDPTDAPDRRYIRRMAEINVLSLSRRLLAEGVDLPEPWSHAEPDIEAALDEYAENLTRWVREGLDRTPKEERDAWDVATLIEIEAWRGGQASDGARLKAYLDQAKQVVDEASTSLNTLGFIYRSLQRQLGRIVSGNSDRIQHFRFALADRAIEQGQAMYLSRDDVTELAALASGSIETVARLSDELAAETGPHEGGGGDGRGDGGGDGPDGGGLEGLGGGGDFYDMARLIAISNAGINVCAMRQNGRTVGTGFLVALRDMLPREAGADLPGVKVILTASHVCYWGDDAPWYYGLGQQSYKPDRLQARFEYQDGRPELNLRPLWTRETAERDWLDASLLLPVGPNSAMLPDGIALDWVAEEPRDADKSYVIGFPEGYEMAVAMKNTEFVAPDRTPNPNRNVAYRARTEPGHSGGPVLVRTGDLEMSVHAVHYRSSNDKTQNFGVWVEAVKEALSSDSDEIIAKVNRARSSGFI